MGNLLSRVVNYIFPQNEIVYSQELQTILPISKNDIYAEHNNIIKSTNIINKDKNIDNVLIV
jgi:hypothetical protein